MVSDHRDSRADATLSTLISTPTSGNLAFLMFLDRIDATRVEGNVVLDRSDGRIRRLIDPDGILRSMSADRNAVVGAVALVGAVGTMVRAFQQRHVDILSRDVLDRRIRSFLQGQCLPSIRDHAAR